MHQNPLGTYKNADSQAHPSPTGSQSQDGACESASLASLPRIVTTDRVGNQ